MKNVLYRRIIAYHAVLSVLNQLLIDGRWTHTTFHEAEELIAAKYGLSDRSIFRYTNGY